MHSTISPWLAQLEERDPYRVHGDTDADVVIVGAGIAGVATAYQLLMHTDKNVLLIDAGMVAHGATGRNAGHVVNEFERPLSDIIRAFGTEMALQGLRDVESAWGIVEEMISMSGLQESYDNCLSYNGIADMDILLENLETHAIRKQAGIIFEPVLVCNHSDILSRIPANLLAHCMPVPHSVILEAAHTNDTSFIAVEIAKIGCMNSAHFCNGLVAWMLTKYANRFRVAENTPVQKVVLEKDSAQLITATQTITARHVVLCTNGFKTVHIENNTGDDIDAAFQKSVKGVAGYMTGYLDKTEAPVAALSYYHPEEYYMTRRPYYAADGTVASLSCMGGIDTPLADQTSFDPTTEIPTDIQNKLTHEMQKTYRDLPETATHTFLWQGLMGYTSNTLRRIGFEPRNPVLLYNLGCNGVGILPSIYGGKRILQLLNREEVSPSIFDPIHGDR